MTASRSSDGEAHAHCARPDARGGVTGGDLPARGWPWCHGAGREWFIALRGLMQALNRPGPALWIRSPRSRRTRVLAYALIYGEGSALPRLRCSARSLATTIVDLAMCIACGLGLHRAPAVSEIPRVGPLLARPTGRVFGRPVRDRRADLEHHAGGVWRVRRGGSADGPVSAPRRWRARQIAITVAALDHIHGAVRRLDGGDRAGSAMRSAAATPWQRGAPGMTAIALGMAGFHGRNDAAAWRLSRHITPLLFLSLDTPAHRTGHAAACRAAAAGRREASSSPTACRTASRSARCAD